MDETTLKSYGKRMLKSIAVEKGLTSSGFNGRSVSRMRKEDFIAFILHQENRIYRDNGDISTMFQELMDDLFQPIIHIMGALTDMDETNPNVYKKNIERIPEEEDEIMPNLTLNSLPDCKCKSEYLKVRLSIHNLETKIRCVVCQTNVRNIVFRPCNHLATCISCFKNPLLDKKCPLCRNRFQDAIRIFS